MCIFPVGGLMHTIYLKATSHSTASAGIGIHFFILVDMQNIPFDLATPQLFITLSVSCLGAVLFIYHLFSAGTTEFYIYVPNCTSFTEVLGNITMWNK